MQTQKMRSYQSSKVVRLSEEEKNLFRKHGVPVSYMKRRIIYASAEPADKVYLIDQGWVSIYRLTRDGQRITVALRCCGDLFGLTAVLYGSEHFDYAETLTSATIIQVPADQLQKIAQDYPPLYLRLGSLLAQRAVEAEDVICDLTTYQVSQRLALLLLRMAQRYGNATADGVMLDLRLTHEDLADMIGTSRPTVTSVLKTFREEKSIHLNGQGIQIHPERLATWVS